MFEREFVLKPILPVGGLMEIFSKSGYGKTTLSLSFAMAISTGSTFLKWDAPKSRKTLYVDGEMSSYEMKERMVGAYRQFNKTDNDAKLPTDVYFSDMEIKNILNIILNTNIFLKVRVLYKGTR